MIIVTIKTKQHHLYSWALPAEVTSLTIRVYGGGAWGGSDCGAGWGIYVLLTEDEHVAFIVQ